MTGYQSKKEAAQHKLAHLTLEQRCRLSEQCLPDAPYRAMLIALHDEMLAALAQPEFIKHHGDDEGWSEWVCPDPDDYLISCCDCSLVHQAQFRVAKYAPAPSEECEIVNDPDLQAQFRMRRSEEWTADDTAHRSGGLPMAQPEQKPVAWMSDHDVGFKKSEFGATPTVPLYTSPYTFARAIEAAIKDNNT